MTHVYDPATAINDPNGITWGMHPIAWRNDDIPEVGEWNTIDIMFDDLAEAGFAGTEVAGWYPSKEETKEKADAAGLRIVAQWFSSFIVRDGVEAVIPDFRATCEYLQFLGATRVVVSEQTGSVQGVRDICIFENKPVLKDEEWPVLAEGLNKLGEIAHEYGLALVYHHHLGTVAQTKDETLRLLELTDPDKVFDTGTRSWATATSWACCAARSTASSTCTSRTCAPPRWKSPEWPSVPSSTPSSPACSQSPATAPSISPSPTPSSLSTATRAGSWLRPSRIRRSLLRWSTRTLRVTM